MAETPYQRSIDQAAKIYGSASEGYNAIKTELDRLSSTGDISAGGAQESQYKALTQQLSEAQKRFNTAEQAYQSAIEAADKATTTAKEFLPAGTTRNRLDTTAGNVLVSVTETADGRGGWSADPASVKRVAVEGADTGGTRVTTPSTDKFIVTMAADGTLTQKPNPNYQPDKNAGPTAVPTSEFIYENGSVKPNPAYRPPNAEINTGARQINDPAHPGQLIDNPNYRAPDAAVSTTAEYIPDPSAPGKFIKNPNYKTPDQALTTGGKAVDTATANTAEGVAQAALSKAQSDAATAQINLADAQRKLAQAPTDAEAQQAKATAQRTLDLALTAQEQAIAQVRITNPIAADQARATLETTRQNLLKSQQGDLYGLPDKIKQIRDLIASGDIKPQDGDAMIAAVKNGTSVFEAQKQMAAEKSAARGQDVTNKDTLASTFGGNFNSALSTFGELNKTGAIGSDATGKAFLATLGLAQDYLKSYELPGATPTDYLGTGSAVGNMANLAQQSLPPMPGGAPAALPPLPGLQAPGGAPPPAPVFPIAPNAGSQPQHVQPITINIGGAGAAAPPPVTPWVNPRPPETSADSVLRQAQADPSLAAGGQLATAASRATPASLSDIAAAFPGAARRHGLI